MASSPFQMPALISAADQGAASREFSEVPTPDF
jgi:hypothetical protein